MGRPELWGPFFSSLKPTVLQGPAWLLFSVARKEGEEVWSVVSSELVGHRVKKRTGVF